MYSDKITQNVALAVMRVMDEELSAKQKKIAVVAGDPKKIDAEDFKKLRKEDVVAEAKHEPAKPNAAAVERRKKLQAIEDRKEKAKAAPSNVRKHEGSAYGGAKQKDEMDESMDAAKSLAQRGMKSEPGSTTHIKRKNGEVVSWQVTGPMKKSNTSDPMSRARSLAQKGMKLPEEVEQMDELNEAKQSEDDYHSESNFPLSDDLHKHNLKYMHDAHEHHTYARDTEDPENGGGPGGAAAKAVKNIDRHVRAKYGANTAKQLQNSASAGNFKKTLAAAKEHMEKKKETTSEETTFSGLLASIHENGLTAIHEMFVRESASEEEFNAELKVAQEKSEGKGKKAEIAKGQVVAVKNEEVEQIDEISTKTLARAARAASDPDSDYGQEKSHDPQKFADYAKKTKDAKSASAVQGAADAKGHYPRPGHTYEYDKLAYRTPSRVTGAGKANKQDTNALKTKMKEETEVVEYELDVNEINGVKMETIDERSLTAAETEKKEDTVKSMKKSMAGFKERYGDRAKEVMYATATKQAKKDA